jgi:hypothetical protein
LLGHAHGHGAGGRRLPASPCVALFSASPCVALLSASPCVALLSASPCVALVSVTPVSLPAAALLPTRELKRIRSPLQEGSLQAFHSGCRQAVSPPCSPRQHGCFSRLHRYTATPLHRYTATPLHRYTATPLHRYTATPLHRYTATPLRFYASIHHTVIPPAFSLHTDCFTVAPPASLRASLGYAGESSARTAGARFGHEPDITCRGHVPDTIWSRTGYHMVTYRIPYGHVPDITCAATPAKVPPSASCARTSAASRGAYGGVYGAGMYAAS